MVGRHSFTIGLAGSGGRTSTGSPEGPMKTRTMRLLGLENSELIPKALEVDWNEKKSPSPVVAKVIPWIEVAISLASSVVGPD